MDTVFTAKHIEYRYSFYSKVYKMQIQFLQQSI
jgi:hypothetical protein